MSMRERLSKAEKRMEPSGVPMECGVCGDYYRPGRVEKMDDSEILSHFGPDWRPAMDVAGRIRQAAERLAGHPLGEGEGYCLECQARILAADDDLAADARAIQRNDVAP